MSTARRSVRSSIALIFAARQSSCGSSTVVLTFFGTAGRDLAMLHNIRFTANTEYRLNILLYRLLYVNTVIRVYGNISSTCPSRPPNPNFLRRRDGRVVGSLIVEAP